MSPLLVSNLDSFKPQTQANSCWAAALANASSKSDNEATYTSDNLNFSDGEITQSNFDKIIESLTLEQITIDDSLWETLNSYIIDDIVLIYYFKLGSLSTKTHFVNIYGCEENTLGKWVYIFDPLPIGSGSKYVLNYIELKNSLSAINGFDGLLNFPKSEITPKKIHSKQKSSGILKKPAITFLQRNIIKNLAENSSISETFKNTIDFPLIPKHKSILTFNELLTSRQFNFRVDNVPIEFKILRWNSLLKVILLVEKMENGFKFLTGIGYLDIELNKIDSIFSLEFLNKEGLYNTIIEILRIGEKISLYIDLEVNLNRMLRIEYQTGSVLQKVIMPIDTKSFMAKPLKDLPLNFDKTQKHIIPSDLKEMQQSTPRDMLNKGKF